MPEGSSRNRSATRPEVVASAALGLLRCDHAQFPVLPGGGPGGRALGAGRRRSAAACWPGRTRSRSSIASSPRRSPPSTASTSTKCRPTAWSTARIDGMLKTLDPHSSFFDPAQLRADARAPGRQLLRPRHPDSGDRRRHHRDVDLRGLAGLQEGAAPRRRHRPHRKRRTPRAWTSEQAVNAQAAKGPKGTTVSISLKRRGYDGLIDLEVERDEVNIVTRPRRVHDRQGDRLHQAGRLLRDLERRGRRGARRSSSAKGMKRLVFDLRDNPGGRSIRRSASRTGSCRAAT